MADTEDVSGSQENTANVVTTEYSDSEKQAMNQGWVPKDQYDGPGRWRTAEEFLDRGELFAKIDEDKRRYKALEGTVEELKKHYKQVRETEYKRALGQLKAEKKNALDAGDSGLVVELDEQIAETKAEAAEAIKSAEAPPQVVPAANPIFNVWVNRNPWYQNDRGMKAYADTIAEELVYNGMTNPVDVLRETEKRVKQEFAHKFNNPNRSKPGAVEGGGAQGSQSRDTFQLTPDETMVMNKFIKAKVLTKEQYIADIKAKRGIQ